MKHQNLLIELLVEELPPKALKELGIQFADKIYNYLVKNDFTVSGFDVLENNGPSGKPYDDFATPRRLAVLVRYVLPQSPSKSISYKLMPASVGLDADGNVTPALLKKLQSLGADESSLKNIRRVNDGKSETLFLDALQPGVLLEDALQRAIEEALAKLPIPKVMTYQLADGWSSVNFVRPAHGLVALHGKTIVNVGALGLKSGNITQGHRFESLTNQIIINSADSYVDQMRDEGAVIVDFFTRKEDVRKQLYKAAVYAAAKDDGFQIFPSESQVQVNQHWLGKYAPIQDDVLLDEVTALVERPNVLVGEFDADFLAIPQECLILTMKANQKYFPLLDANKNLTNKFLIVSNISPADPSAVIQGNERVVRPRLADAKFFFDQDRKKTLESRVAGLDKVVYHNKLGSQGERTERVQAIAKAIGQQLGGDKLAAQADQAAMLAKADLVTDMVGEFPELQGIMGRYYAQHKGLDNDVAYAIEDHYKPRFAGDELPRNQVGICVALADKLETLLGMFGIGNIPTGDKDPFALRRHALGVVRILIEAELPFSLDNLINLSLSASDQLGNDPRGIWVTTSTSTSSIEEPGIIKFLPNTANLLIEFIFDRLSSYLREAGYSSNEIDSVLSLNPSVLSEVPHRLAAVQVFTILEEAPALAAANKRVGNILKKVEGEVKAEVNANLLQEPAEIALNKALSKVKPEADKLFEIGDYTASLQALAALKAPVDDFFDNVMVNADDVALKNNRLGLLAILHQTMNRVADLSKLAS